MKMEPRPDKPFIVTEITYMNDEDFPAWLETEMMEGEDTGIIIREDTPAPLVDTIYDLPF